ncbi:hypothetical protein [Pontiella sulfatireligans]|uniref:Lipoprotein n=1 Tax=Pontiella sulfatireligans TaxID=2750658 RepID=A0A6C2UQC2_9BACT|nr:hypothetical protein [Pontiella sulfatireligans]VGO22492.1 hypothetical protein SCARR_04575 [Pontiella sulfatireligans]
MKKIMFYGLAAMIALGAGCKKREDGTTEMMSAEEVQETAVKVAEKTEEVTKKASAAVSSFTVKTEDVMSDLNVSVKEIKEKVAAFDKNEVLAYAEQYKHVILEKKDQIGALTEKVKGLSMTEVIGEKGKALKDQLSQYTGQLNGLKDRYGIYLDKLKGLGVDLSAYGL